MSRKQWQIIILLGLADCVVLGMLVLAITLTPRLAAGGILGPTPTPTPTPTSVLPPTWTPTPSPTPAPTPTPRPTATPSPTVPTPTPLPTFTPTPIPPPELANARFDTITPFEITGWVVDPVVNWHPGEPYDPNNSYAYPKFKYADDPARFITGNTLQIESSDQYAKFQVTIYQIVSVPPGTKVQFEIQAKGYSDEGGIIVRAGIDPRGGDGCGRAQWGQTRVINQNDGQVALRSPQVRVGEEGKVTVCFFAQPEWAVPHKAAFFDDARLVVFP